MTDSPQPARRKAMMTIAEAAEYTGLTRGKLYTYITGEKQPRLDSVKLDGRRYVRVADAARWVRSLQVDEDVRPATAKAAS